MQKEGTLIYCRDDEKLKEIVENSRNDINKIPYSVPDYKIEDGITSLLTTEGAIPLDVFGKHNLLNINGARLICNALGIKDEQFYKAISTFDGAANRLELVGKQETSRLYKDFAHAPSKVKATIEAVREQFPEHKFVACLELHTFSSLSKNFLSQYSGSFDKVDDGCIYYNPHALSLKRLPDLKPEDVEMAFGNKNLAIFADSKEMTDWLIRQKNEKVIYLMMSSGNFDGIDLKDLANATL
jgi:UDP-N-acetylmuramate: L-alanyl-gamma-D-glutamyl-meso-diaminopimelate ligase